MGWKTDKTINNSLQQDLGLINAGTPDNLNHFMQNYKNLQPRTPQENKTTDFENNTIMSRLQSHKNG